MGTIIANFVNVLKNKLFFGTTNCLILIIHHYEI